VYEVPENHLIDVYSNFETVKKEKNWIKDSID
jgi:hypothetical protein